MMNHSHRTMNAIINLNFQDKFDLTHSTVLNKKLFSEDTNSIIAKLITKVDCKNLRIVFLLALKQYISLIFLNEEILLLGLLISLKLFFINVSQKL